MPHLLKTLFRIGTTSYIYEDHILPNVRNLKGQVDDIELVLFEDADTGNIPSQQDLAELKQISAEMGLTYTVHLPLDIDLGAESASKRKTEIQRVARLIGHFAFLQPFAYVLHLNLTERLKRTITAWRISVNDSLQELLSSASIDPKDIAVENLQYPFHYVEDIIEKNDLSVCVDIGHLNLRKEDVFAHLAKHLHRTRVIHWHGIREGKDHVSLSHALSQEVRSVIGLLHQHKYNGVVTLEVFNQNDLEESLLCIKGSL